MLENITTFTVFLYVIGLVLLIIEAIAPGFGVAGIGGVVCVIVSIVMISNSLYDAMLMIVGTTAVIMLIAIGLYKLGIGKRILGKFILSTEQKNDEGYSSTQDYKNYIGKKGTAITPLRSSGVVVIDGERIDAVSEGEFIEKDSVVEIVRVDGRRIVVRETK